MLRKQPNVLDFKHFSAVEDHSSSPVPPIFVNTTEGRQKLSKGKSFSQRLGRAKERSVICRKVSVRA